ncbi:PTS sugar transporter subunit IIB [Amedibacillus sp. YH-ame6]
MIHIGMFCFAGMSTSVLVARMKECADNDGIECTINAYPETEVADKAKDLDIVLIGPQIKYMKKRIEALCTPLGVKVMVVSNVDFGRMDARHVLDEAMKLLEEK